MRNDVTQVSILGGGIGGLALANALQRQGIPFQLFEQASELGEVGAGIGMSAAALQILGAFGLEEQVRDAGAFVKEACIANKNLEVLRWVPADVNSVCIHRAKLISILSSKLDRSSIHLNKKVVQIQTAEKQTEVAFADGTKHLAACVAAADGIHSQTRKALFPGVKTRYSNQIIWRGITKMTPDNEFQNRYFEIWDEEKRFLFLQLDAENMFWLAVVKGPPGGKDNPATVREELLELFQRFHPFMKDLIRGSANFIRNDLADLGGQSRPWFHKNVVFLGDAIHATTPNLAQGGCQAIEDAFCLSKILAKQEKWDENTFRTYQKLREPKVHFIINTSWRFGESAHSANPLLHGGVKTFFKYAPASIFRNQEKKLNDLSYLERI